MAAIFDFRSCDIWEHFYVHRWIDQTPKHGITHQDHLSRLNDTKVMRVFNFGYFGWRPYWIWPKKVPSRFFPPGILIDLVNRPPKDNNYVGFKTIPIFSRSNSIFMRLQTLWEPCQWNLCQYTIIFINKIIFENIICKMSTISSLQVLIYTLRVNIYMELLKMTTRCRLSRVVWFIYSG